MIRQLPGWIRVGAILLPMVAGAVNAIALSGFAHKSVTHVTGTVTETSLALFEFNWLEMLRAFFLIVSFLSGAIISGFLVGGEDFKVGKRYGVALIVESFLLFLAWFLFKRGLIVGEYLLSAASGLQNAMIATYSGAIIRTTHLTGVLSDIGSLLGNFLRGKRIDKRYLLLLFSIFVSFFIGGLLGGMLYSLYREQSLMFPCSLTLVLGVIYVFIRHRRYSE